MDEFKILLQLRGISVGVDIDAPQRCVSVLTQLPQYFRDQTQADGSRRVTDPSRISHGDVAGELELDQSHQRRGAHAVHPAGVGEYLQLPATPPRSRLFAVDGILGRRPVQQLAEVFCHRPRRRKIELQMMPNFVPDERKPPRCRYATGRQAHDRDRERSEIITQNGVSTVRMDLMRRFVTGQSPGSVLVLDVGKWRRNRQRRSGRQPQGGSDRLGVTTPHHFVGSRHRRGQVRVIALVEANAKKIPGSADDAQPLIVVSAESVNITTRRARVYLG